MESQFPAVLKMGGEIFLASNPDGTMLAVAVRKYGRFTFLRPDELEEMLVGHAKKNNDRSSLSRSALVTEGNGINGVLMPVVVKDEFELSQQMHERFAKNAETGFLIAKSDAAEWLVRKELRFADAVSVAVDTVRILLG
jgi:hypothetical protein